MKNKFHFLTVVCAGFVINASAADTSAAPKENVFATRPLGIQLSIKMDGPYQEPADLQIICVIEAGPSFFDGAVKQVSHGIDSVTAELAKRDATSYASNSK